MRVWPRPPEPRPDRRHLRLTPGRLAAVSIAGLVLAGCGDSTPDGAVPLASLERVRAVLDGATELCLLVAATSAQRTQGLADVTALPAGVDGMVFEYPSPSTARFHMAGTLLPLDIAFVSGTTVVDTEAMQPCHQSPCPTFGPELSFDAAVETVTGRVDWTTVTTVELGGACPALDPADAQPSSAGL